MNLAAIARLLGAVAVILVFASVTTKLLADSTGHYQSLARLFYVDSEQNIPSLYSTMLLLISALLLSVIAVLKSKQRAAYAKYWALLSVGFLVMAIDEAASIHEITIRPMRNLLGGGELGIFHFAWVVPGIILVLALAVYFLKFLSHLPANTRSGFLLAAALFIGGSIGFELIGGRYAELHGTQSLFYSLIVTVEESLEMAGVIVFIRALLVYITETYKDVQFRFDNSTDRSQSMVIMSGKVTHWTGIPLGPLHTGENGHLSTSWHKAGDVHYPSVRKVGR